LNFSPDLNGKAGTAGEIKCHDFQEDLKFSELEEEAPFLNAFYHTHFPYLVKIEKVIDESLQKRGVDKIFHTRSGRKIFVDEKARRKEYGDILLEEFSDWKGKKPGWCYSDKITDYISYVIVPKKIVTMVPFLLMQSFFVLNYDALIKLYGRRFSFNKGYETSNIPIPISVLFHDMLKPHQYMLSQTQPLQDNEPAHNDRRCAS
jgi:hypothetical protein